jgi:hypothetical protein
MKKSEVSNSYIKKALDELMPLFGVRDYEDEVFTLSDCGDTSKLRMLIAQGQTKEAVSEMASQFNLPVAFRIIPTNKFQSKHLVKTDHEGHSIAGITAQVMIPSNLPLYGTAKMKDFPIDIRVSKNCAKKPEVFICVIAHELSHVLLYSMRHPEKENEFYTDLIAMLIGFRKIMKSGRKVVKKHTTYSGQVQTTHTNITTYGYLSDDNFDFAYAKIEEYLRLQKAIEEKLLLSTQESKVLIANARKQILLFNAYLEGLHKHETQNMSSHDAQKINTFRLPSHNDALSRSIGKVGRLANQSALLTEAGKAYTAKDMKKISKSSKQLSEASKNLASQYARLKNDVRLLEKHTGFFKRIAIKIKLKSATASAEASNWSDNEPVSTSVDAVNDDTPPPQEQPAQHQPEQDNSCGHCYAPIMGGQLYCYKCGVRARQSNSDTAASAGDGVQPKQSAQQAEQDSHCNNCKTATIGGQLYCYKCGERAS